MVIIGPIHPDFGLDGFPFNNKIEVVLFIISLLCIFSKSKETNKKTMYIVSFLFLTSASLSVISSENSFDACYTTSQTPTSNFEMSFNIKDNCQFSYEVPFNKQVTRNDYLLNFNSTPKNANGIEFTNWNLYFFNQTGFNFYDKAFYGGKNDLDIQMHWIIKDNNFERVSYSYLDQNDSVKLFDYGFNNIVLPVEPSRTWLSFGVNWKSRSAAEKQEILVNYVGEVELKINNTDIVTLPSSYKEVSTSRIKLPENSSIEIDYFYRYNAGINSYPNIPYASFSITNTNGESLNPLKSSYELVLEFINLIIVFIIFLYAILKVNRKRKDLLINFSLLLFIFVFYEHIPNSISEYIEILFIGVLAYLIFYKKLNNIVTFNEVALCISILSIKNLNIYSNVLYSIGGSDPLKYESWSQQIIYFSSLQGGEDIFRYQPGYRYFLSLVRLVFGDSHIAISLFARYIFVILILTLFIKIKQKFENNKIFLSVNLIILYIFFSTYSSKLNLYSSLSEWPTWLIAISIAIYIFKNNLTTRDIIYLSSLIGLCFLIRENQLPGLFVLFIIFVTKLKDKNKSILSTVIISLFLFLPFYHNFYYGGQFILEENIFREDIFYVSPSDILFNFSEIRDKLFFQLNFLLANPFSVGVNTMAGKILPLVVNLILFQWIFVVIKLLFQKEFFSIENFMFVILPLSLLTPHIFYQVHTYYPRHIMQGYFFMLVSAIYLNLKNNHDHVV